MNPGKAKEFFSEYYEGSLEPGLRQSFESELASDAQLQAEYRAFVQVFEKLGGLKALEIEPPFDLHERISAKLDHHLFEHRDDAQAPIGAWWRSFAFGTLAVAAIVGAVISLKLRSNDGTMTGAIISAPSTTPPSIVMKNGSPTLQYRSVGRSEIIVQEEGKASALEHFRLNDQRLMSPLVNKGESSVLLTIERKGDRSLLRVALPGAVASVIDEGQGSTRDLALALASYYHEPVLVEVKDLGSKVSWSFSNHDNPVAATLSNKSLAIEQLSSNMLRLISQ